MKIDYIKNPFAIVKKINIPYGEDLHLEGRIIGHIEEGYSDVNWFSGQLVYSKHGCEVGGQKFGKLHEDLKRGAPTIMEVKIKIKRWCDSMNLRIASEVDVREGVSYEHSRELETLCVI